MNKRTKKTIANIVIVAMILCGAAWIASNFIHLGGEFTDNAQVEQDIVNITSRVQGFISSIRISDYQHVSKGDTLFTIEDSEFQLHLAQAEAALENAKTSKSATAKGAQGVQKQIDVNDAGISEVEVLLRNAETDYQRYKTLYEQEAVTQQQLDAVRTQYESLKVKVEAMRRQKVVTGIAHDETSLRVDQQNYAIDVAEAALRLARLNLSYCTITSPCDGYAARNMVQEGELVMPGMRLVRIVDDSRRWVVANFRESQLSNISTGNRVRIKADAYPDTEFEGRVTAISAATGARHSPVAPDNSTGTFVKVEQRIPVKIEFTDANDAEKLRSLAAGMNVECVVEVK